MLHDQLYHFDDHLYAHYWQHLHLWHVLAFDTTPVAVSVRITPFLLVSET